MTIKLAYIKERDGLVFLCDKEGKELPLQVFRLNKKMDTLVRYAKPVDISAALVKVPERRTFEQNDVDGWKHEVRGFNQCLNVLEGK